MREPKLANTTRLHGGVTWQISGWYKPGLCVNDEQVHEPKFHVTCVTPERVLENTLLFNVVEKDVERQVLQNAVQRPCQRRVLAPHQQRPQPNPDSQQQRQQPQGAPHSSNINNRIRLHNSTISNSLIAILNQHFGPDNQTEMFIRALLRNRTHRPHEMLPELTHEIRCLMKLEYPTGQFGILEDLAKKHFVDAIPGAERRWNI